MSKTARRFPPHHLWALLAYFVLTVLMTWPSLLYFTTGIPGDGFDGWQNLWNLWWVKKALLIEGSSPYYTHYIYPPAGASLLFHTLNIFNSFWTLPIQLNFGLTVAYNSVVFVSFVLAGYGVYLLALYTLSHLFPSARHLHLAAFVGGVVFTMSPFHMAHLLGHMQVFSMIWPPFYVLWLLRTLAPWSNSAAPPPRQWRNAAISSLFLVLASLVAWYHTLYLLIFTGITLIWTLYRRWQIVRNRPKAYPYPTKTVLRLVGVILAIGLGFALVMSPILIPMIRDASNRPDLETGLVQNITLSADLLAFVLPSEMHPLWGHWAKRIADNFSTTTSERLIFAGFVPLALTIFIFVRRGSSHIIKFWGLMTALFFVLALGPFLHIGGQVVAIGGWQLPMPYLLLYHTVPFIDLTRSLSRYDLMVMLALGVLTALAIGQLTTRKSRLPIRNATLFTLLVGLMILFEFLPVPYPVSKIDTPRFDYDLAQQPGDYTIAELPMNWDRPTPMLHQTVHGKRVLTAYTSRNQSLDLARRTPVLQQWRYLGPDIIDLPLAKIAPTIFYDFNLRYIVLDYWQMPPGPERQATEQWVAAALPGIQPVYDDGRLKVYPTPPKVETVPYLSLGNGWSERQEQRDDNNMATRNFSASQPAELFLHHPQNRPVTLEITAVSGQPDGQQIQVFVGNQPVDNFAVDQTVGTYPASIPPQADTPLKISLQADPPTGTITVSRIGLDVPTNGGEN